MALDTMTPIRRVLLVHNSPRVGRYFSRLRSGIASLEIFGCRVAARIPRSSPPPGTIEEIIAYGMLRKRARPHYGKLRLSVTRGLYRAAARLHYAHVMSSIRRYRPDALGVWGGNALDAKAVVVAAHHSKLPCFQFENGFLPNTTQMDTEGVNVDSSVPRDPDFYYGYEATKARELPQTIAPRSPLRSKRGASSVRLPERYMFVPFQVQLDSQILLHSPWIQGMSHFFHAVTRAAREVPGSVVLVFKEHPNCPLQYPELHREADQDARLIFANGNPTDELIRNAAGVITINSTVGTESLLLTKPVLALGNAVYEVPGVASSARSVSQITAWLSQVWEGRPPSAPIRGRFLRFLAEEYLIPDRHQDPGPEHFRAVEAKLRAWAGGA